VFTVVDDGVKYGRKHGIEFLDGFESALSHTSEFWVLLRFSWLIFIGFQAEFSAVKEDPDSIVFKEPEASCCRLDGLNPAVESLGDSITDWRSKPRQDSVEAGLQHPRDLPDGIEPAANRPRVP